MKEIGSEFWDVPTSNKRKLTFEDLFWFVSGRSALKAIIDLIKKENPYVKSVAMPSWCCESMIRPFIDANIAVNFYPVYYSEKLIQETTNRSDILFIMDYFGYEGAEKNIRHNCVIRDVTHSFFSNNYEDADYFFGSFRKWFGIYTGGFAWTSKNKTFHYESGDITQYVALRKTAMIQKEAFIIGEELKDKSYLQLFQNAENMLEDFGVLPAAKRDIQIIKNLDVELIKGIRRTNASILMKALQDYLIFRELRDNDCPLFVPILVPSGKRDALRTHLIEQGIYCPVHWPRSEFHKLDKRTRAIYDNELSLVCDQRYSQEDMVRIVEIIKDYL